MTEIIIRSFAKYRDLFGAEHKVEVPIGGTIADALILFAGEHPVAQTELFEQGMLKSHVVLMHNKERVDHEDINKITPENGDQIVLYPPVSGG